MTQTVQTEMQASDNIGANLIINGDMRIAQRGTSFVSPSNGAYLTDRWLIVGGGLTSNVTVNQSTTVPNTTFLNSLHVDVTTAKASLATSDLLRIAQKIEGYNAAIVGLGTADAQSLTVSFWVRSTKTGTHYVTITPQTGTTQYYPASYTVNASDTWEHKTVTITGTTSGTFGTSNDIGFVVEFILAAGTDWEGTANTWNATQEYSASGAVNILDNTANNFFLTGVKLEVGSTATDFVPDDYATALAKCQRYYYEGAAAGASIGAFSSSVVHFSGSHPVEMRSAPTVTIEDTSPDTFIAGTQRVGASSANAGLQTSTKGYAQLLNGFTGMTAGQAGYVNQTTSILSFSAEL